MSKLKEEQKQDQEEVEVVQEQQLRLLQSSLKTRLLLQTPPLLLEEIIEIYKYDNINGTSTSTQSTVGLQWKQQSHEVQGECRGRTNPTLHKKQYHNKNNHRRHHLDERRTQQQQKPQQEQKQQRQRKDDYESNDETNYLLTIGHRGASYHVPEHTIGSYQLALELGADYIEPDLVVTADGYLIAMHSTDLNITTNIRDVFTTDRIWYSPYQKRYGYWSFNFTLKEIQQLTVQQRLPTARTHLYDHNIFHIPTLDDIVQLLYEWNVNTIPLLKNRNIIKSASQSMTQYHSSSSSIDATTIATATTFSDTTEDTNEEQITYKTVLSPSQLALYQSGIYIELKESQWTLQDTGYDVVEILFRYILQSIAQINYNNLNTTTNTTDPSIPFPVNYWDNHLWKPCYDEIRYDDYILPPLVIQSFNIHDLQQFHDLWDQYKPYLTYYDTTLNTTTTNADSTDRGIPTKVPIPEPPYVLLMEYPDCMEEDIWFEIGSKYRSVVQGIGCDKQCLLVDSTSTNTIVREKVRELDLILHPWTSRPEVSETMVQFNSSFDELRYLQCNVGIHGIFAESVSQAVASAMLGCDDFIYADTNNNDQYGTNEVNCNMPNTTTANNNSSSNNLLIMFGSFGIGFVFATLFFVSLTNHRQSTKKEQQQQQQQNEQDDTTDQDDANDTRTVVTNRSPNRQKQSTRQSHRHSNCKHLHNPVPTDDDDDDIDIIV